MSSTSENGAMELFMQMWSRKALALATNTCVFCTTPVVVDELRCELSKKEWFISGMCQACQDKVFDQEEEQDECETDA